MRTAPVKAIALPADYRANLEFQSRVIFQGFVHAGCQGFKLQTLLGGMTNGNSREKEMM